MSAETLISGGTVLSMDPAIGDLRRGDVLLRDGEIAAVAASIEAPPGATVIDAGGMIVMPGLVESHRHLFYSAFRGSMVDFTMSDWKQEFLPRIAAKLIPEDVYASTLLGAVEAISQGITTVLDWCSVANTGEHADAALAAIRTGGIRAVFAHGSSIGRKLGTEAPAEAWSSARRMREEELADDGGLVRMALALLGPEQTEWEATADDIATARDLGLPMSMHVGGRRPAPEGVRRLQEGGLLGPDMNFAHCCSTTDEELRMIAAAGATATASPSAEILLGSGTPASGRLREAGLRLALGADSVASASGDLFEEGRMAIAAERVLRASELYADGANVERTEQLGLSTREALEAITSGGAQACWLGEEVGSLTPGKRADVILIRAGDLNLFPAGDVAGTLATCATGSNVDTVLLDGRVVKRGGALVGVDVDGIRAAAEAARERVYGLTDYPGLRP
jgi:5-methylthioadenosine/S-adenosylhomocysteine deaminase